MWPFAEPKWKKLLRTHRSLKPVLLTRTEPWHRVSPEFAKLAIDVLDGSGLTDSFIFYSMQLELIVRHCSDDAGHLHGDVIGVQPDRAAPRLSFRNRAVRYDGDPAGNVGERHGGHRRCDDADHAGHAVLQSQPAEHAGRHRGLNLGGPAGLFTGLEGDYGHVSHLNDLLSGSGG
jgi:hypothetical protein